MSNFGQTYAQYYNLLYQEKDYKDEVQYVNNLIQNTNPSSQTLLDLGCGTGVHARLFSQLGYQVHGVDLSADMLEIARQKNTLEELNIDLTLSDINDLNLHQTFDIVTSLFHVVSYQNTNDKLLKMFHTVKKHLAQDGLFIFDFWYGPAVLTDLPTVRVKRVENADIEVTRIAEPKLQVARNTVDVHYDIFIRNKENNAYLKKKELHEMRYLFDTELELICDQMGFKIKNKYKWLSNDLPCLNSWNVVWVLTL